MRSLDLFVDRHLVVVRTELLDFQPFCGVAAVFLSAHIRAALSNRFLAARVHKLLLMLIMNHSAVNDV